MVCWLTHVCIDWAQDLPASLQVELLHSRYGDLLRRVPFFDNMESAALNELCQHMKSFTIMPGDPIMLRGECGDELLFLCTGVARLSTKKDDGSYHTYAVGHFWGELEFLGIQSRRPQTVLASTYCEIASLSPKKIGAGSTRDRLSAVRLALHCTFPTTFWPVVSCITKGVCLNSVCLKT